MARVGRQELRWSPPARKLFHAFPEVDGLAWVVARVRCEQDPDVICFRFMSATEREQYTYLRPSPQRRHCTLRQKWIHPAGTGRRTNYLERRIRELPLTHPFGSVTSQRMSDLVP